ncbi:ABC transporter substrate-binding protein [Litorivicinus sp.]|nr:ABC transporter substrate-binding protein [Litorivicinus sp.]
MEIKLAIDRYDRHFPFFDGSLAHSFDFDIEPFQVGQSALLQHGTDRHELFLDGQFDVAEFSMSSFLAAKTRGYPIVGIPVFPRRLFSTSQMWVKQDSDMTEPKHLIGKNVALSAFQTTLSLLAKGDLEFHYKVPWRSINWKLTTKEKIPLEHGPDVSVEFIGERDRLGDRLQSGEIDAFFLPHPPANVMNGEIPARRLFLDPESEEKRYFDHVGSFPIMHVIAIQDSLASQNPDLPLQLMEIFHSAFDIAEGYYADPNWSMLPGVRHQFERDRERFQGSAWPRGFAANRSNIDTLMRYAVDQGIGAEYLPPEALFAGGTLGT